MPKFLVYPQIQSQLMMGDKNRDSRDKNVSVASLVESLEPDEQRSAMFQNLVTKKNTITEAEKDYVIIIPKSYSKVEDMAKSTNDVVSALMGKNKDAAKSAASVLSTISESAGSGYNQSAFYKNLEDIKIGDGEPGLYIVLPLKAEFLKISLGPKWGMEEETYGEAMKHIIGGMGEILAGGEGAVMEGLKSIGGGLLSGMGGTLYKKFMKGSVSQVGGNIYTSQRQSFQGIDPIQLKFSWTLTPRDVDEALIIKKIVKIFQLLSAPSKPVKIDHLDAYLRRNPALWEIRFPNGEAMKNLIVKDNKFPAMVCNGVDVNNGMGDSDDFWITFENKFPNVIKLDLTFTEYFSTYSGQEKFGYDSVEDILKITE